MDFYDNILFINKKYYNFLLKSFLNLIILKIRFHLLIFYIK
jgi:ribonuclease HIII